MMDPTRINNYNKFLITLDNKNDNNTSNLNPPKQESKLEEINRTMKDDESIKKEIDKIIDNINNNFHISNISSSNFTGQSSNDLASSYLEPNDPNKYIDFLNKNLNIKIYKYRPQNIPIDEPS